MENELSPSQKPRLAFRLKSFWRVHWPEIIVLGLLFISLTYGLLAIYHAPYPVTIIYAFYSSSTTFKSWLSPLWIVGLLIAAALFFLSVQRYLAAIVLGLTAVVFLFSAFLALVASPYAIQKAAVDNHVYVLFYQEILSTGERYIFYRCDKLMAVCNRLDLSEVTYFTQAPTLIVDDKDKTISVMTGDEILYTYRQP